MTILRTAVMEEIMMIMMEMKEDREEIAMMMTTQEGVQIMIDPEKGKEAGAEIMVQEEADLGAEDQDTFQLCQKCLI